MNEKLDAIQDFELNQFTGRYMLHMLARLTDYANTQMGRASLFETYVDRNPRTSYDIEHILPDDYASYWRNPCIVGHIKIILSFYGWSMSMDLSPTIDLTKLRSANDCNCTFDSQNLFGIRLKLKSWPVAGMMQRRLLFKAAMLAGLPWNMVRGEVGRTHENMALYRQAAKVAPY